MAARENVPRMLKGFQSKIYRHAVNGYGSTILLRQNAEERVYKECRRLVCCVANADQLLLVLWSGSPVLTCATRAS